MLVAACNLSFTNTGIKNNASNSATEKQDGFAVVELFTSEGCSSCPSADAVVERVSEEYNGKVFVLGFHVDYWDNLGWRDAFSNASYSERQQQYAQLFHLNSVYTPQVIVNGKTEFVGSNENKLRSVINDELNKTPSSILAVDAKDNNNNTITVSYKTDKTSASKLQMALVQLHAETNVQRGENEGRVLHHINIVKELKTISIDGETHGVLQFDLPKDFTTKDFTIIAYLQDAADMRVIAAIESEIH